MPCEHKPTDDLSEEELHVIVSGIRQILRMDFADGKWDPDKEWSRPPSSTSQAPWKTPACNLRERTPHEARDHDRL